ncbi:MULTISPECIES: septum formation family protein [unclassified Streptomyces]|uniref:septum formation family protein n=1 Tax=unclassified Streptomyces TaxID=2593676 RepID=UPI002E36FE60|nr:septum formation family protein [Streptomyces sp. NBC_01460]WSS25733.1 septum formation family protein [Streptomyces sp. NBC_01185]
MFSGVTSRPARHMSAAVALLAIGAVGCADVIDSAKDGAKKVVRQRSVFSLDPGDCYNPNAGVGDGEEVSVEVVPCTEAHKGQVVGEFSVDEKSEYPGDAELSKLADTGCPPETQKFVSDPWAVPEGVGLFIYYPTKESWATGDRAVSCTYAKESGTFAGSLKNTSLDADQRAYLKGADAVYQAFWNNQPEAEQIDKDLPGYKKQAKAVSKALDAHLASLKSVDQPETVKLRTQLGETAEAWKDAASAGSIDDFYIAYDMAFTGIDPQKTVAARKELKLTTTVPADDAEVWAS